MSLTTICKGYSWMTEGLFVGWGAEVWHLRGTPSQSTLTVLCNKSSTGRQKIPSLPPPSHDGGTTQICHLDGFQRISKEHKATSCDYFGAKPVPGDGIEEHCGMERQDVIHSTSGDVPPAPRWERAFLKASPPRVTACLLLKHLRFKNISSLVTLIRSLLPPGMVGVVFLCRASMVSLWSSEQVGEKIRCITIF